MADGIRDPDEAAFREDLQRTGFVVGEASGHWAIVEITWPHVLVWIAAAGRNGSPDQFHFRLRCAGYPGRGPTGALWNAEKNQLLEHSAFPKGRTRVAHVFRTNWENGASLYHPFDGLALEKHSDWPAKYPDKLWTRHHTIGEWLAEFHELLNCDEYEGVAQ
jgi:hypothetical protein